MFNLFKNKMTELVIGADKKGQESIKKGEAGEARVCAILASYGVPYLQNVYIPRGEGKYTEVDILVVHTTGLYVIEVKNYNSQIIGNTEDTKWEARYKGGQVYPMYNPIKQNRGHKMGVENELNRRGICVGIVVFTGDTVRLTMQGQLKEREYVIHERELGKVLKKETKTRRIYSTHEVTKIYKHLEKYTGVGYLKKRKHIYNVKKAKKGSNRIKNRRCT